ncbi:23S rRNA (uracil(1939)-C(5))-methyltransferase RlmD [Paenibacillus arenilitoris]|uniref:23S rRNA (Uracil(1939)-C(5))-methyltransferase RlmD n=1 Tax=Paenibacillus arenilitoris TaxID=2772299 RepID=A0A927CKP5_9BACL|nr:23S rRNA (uracil(1939)-C(5))-methyltransferase RlmD [Paenibacillus arenilitoris]MBD2868947.1 23S rRNA (uracil(1939)-C(5))-methyltransferase RlmD [Paenibacillus arenilitoris]
MQNSGKHKGGRGRARGGTRSGGTAAAAAAADAPFQKNEQVVADIIGLTHDGEGVGRADGFTLFIQGALPGERVRAKVMKVKKQYGYARLEELLEASPDRVQPLCPIHKECGGCQLQHLDYPAQLAWKRQHVADNLTRIGKLTVAEEAGEGVVVRDTVGMDEPWRYRNKAAVPVGAGAEEDGLAMGFYAQGSHRIIDMDECHIQDERNDETIRAVKRIASELGVPPYDEESGRGLLRHVVVRTGVVTGEIMVVLITNGRKLPQADRLAERIREVVPAVKSIVQNVNERSTNAIFGEETITLWGSDVIYDELDGIRFAISARSFYQVNPAQTVKLYRKAVDYAGLTGSETVIDAYCGIGTISLFLARRAGRVYGVEIVPEAIEDAARNAELNGIANAAFEAGPAEVVIPRWREEGIAADVIVVDPPRKGCDAALLETIIAMRPERVVYVSCNPSTLARDLRVLEDGGFRTVEVTPVDMFPQTMHVECCSLLVRKD